MTELQARPNLSNCSKIFTVAVGKSSQGDIEERSCAYWKQRVVRKCGDEMEEKLRRIGWDYNGYEGPMKGHPKWSRSIWFFCAREQGGRSYEEAKRIVIEHFSELMHFHGGPQFEVLVD